ncbi:MAG: hypothetical protein ACE5Z5_09220 [Candidatus Bathyarchaeia archaeon]
MWGPLRNIGMGACDLDRTVVKGVNSLEELVAKPAFYRPPYTLNHNERETKMLSLTTSYPIE